MRMVPGSHQAQLAHRDTFARTTSLRGQEIASGRRGARGRYRAAPGEMSLHHVRMVRGRTNRSDDVASASRSAIHPTYVKQLAGDGDSASNASGSHLA